jgi:hypothetical protein
MSLNENFDSTKVYSSKEVTEFMELISTVKVDINALIHSINFFWTNKRFDVNQDLIDSLVHAQELIDSFEINIKKNNYVVVQQEWMREAFKKMFLIDNIVVALPVKEKKEIVIAKNQASQGTFQI